MLFIKIYDTINNRSWTEKFDSYYLFKKRVNKIKYSKRLRITSRSNIID